MTGETYDVPSEGRLLSRYWETACGFWTDRQAWRAWLLALALIATMLLQILIQYWLNYWNRDFFDAIERRNAAELWTQALRFVPLAASSTVLAVFSVWGRMTMQRRWRAWLSDRLYDYWLGHDRYRRLRFMAGEHDTPEFRIAEDGRVATDLPIDLVLGLLTSVITVVIFIGVLSTLGGTLTFTALGWSVAVPGYLVPAVIAYSLLVTAATILIGRHLTHVLEQNKRAEAELRSIGTHVREKGEGIAMPDGKDGRRVVAAALDTVIRRWVEVCWQFMRTTLVSHVGTVLTPVIGLLLCVPQYVAGAMTLGEVVQAAGAFAVVHGAFNWVTENYGRLAEWTASANRVASLLLALDRVDGLTDADASKPAAD